MASRRIQWLAVAVPAAVVGIFEYIRHWWLEPLLPPGMGNLAGALVSAGTVYAFVRVLMRMIERSALEATRARAETAVILERQRIARDMHDHVAQALFYLTVKLRQADALAGAGEVEPVRRELQTMAGHLQQTYDQVRTVISDLKRQEELEDFGTALQRVVHALTERTGLQVHCEADGHPNLTPGAQQQVLAIVHEALTNAHRHGQARRATVRVRPVSGGISLEVADDGRGFNPTGVPRHGGHGLSIMAERAQMAGGELHIDAGSGRGTRVTVFLPGVKT